MRVVDEALATGGIFYLKHVPVHCTGYNFLDNETFYLFRMYLERYVENPGRYDMHDAFHRCACVVIASICPIGELQEEYWDAVQSERVEKA